MAPSVTLLDLVTAVAEEARGEAELIATVVHLVNSGTVRLCGNFKGARFDVDSLPPGPLAASSETDVARRVTTKNLIDVARILETHRRLRTGTLRQG